MLKIRLMRIGAKKKPFYRVVVLDERAKRTGAYIELLGTYNPLTEPKDIKLKQDRIDHWVKQGAQLSTGFLRIIGKAPQRPPRKPKKSHAAEAPRDEKEKKEELVKEVPALETAKTVAASRLSEAGESASESTSPAVAGAELEKQDQPSDQSKPEKESEKKNEGSA